MKKTVFSLLLVCALLGGLVGSAFADEADELNNFSRGNNWVTFRANNAMESNFTSSAVTDALSQLQPGDTCTFTIHLKNEHASATRWYMTNEVRKSLEEARRSSLQNGAYTYILRYQRVPKVALPNNDNAPDPGVLVLFDSTAVGGESRTIDSEGKVRQGLFEATEGLEDWFALDTLASGAEAQVELVVALDGESQGNIYQDTWAKIRMNFAVELQNTTPSTTTGTGSVVKTGDSWDLKPYYIVMAVTGLLFLFLAVDGVKQRKRERQVRRG